MERISNDDYFRLNAPFRLWLRKEKHLYFDELSSEEARRRFASFVRAWNAGRLRSRYYSQDHELTHLSKDVLTRHNWSFAKDTPAQDQPKKESTSGRLVDSDQDDRDRRHRRKRERRDARDREQLMLDEVAPRETGRDAKIAKRRNLNQIRHAEPSVDPELPDHDLYGSSANDLAALKRERELKEKQRTERRQQSTHGDPAARQSRLNDHLDKERGTVEVLRAMAQQSREQGLGMMPPPPP
ncbi:hypothetical protein GGF44_006065 [Coemansia sp. RSA 1694]|nr:hypothetical protein IWW47_000262 [Coemansia sp. RSA 2052]KAJ2584793.1 hypothetical protein GGH95_000113 [Coemansia sp. RSA 1836]KAJ2612918.1 hypothetical protein GGF44_006065 [Coemansia sp. RSA 1694]